MFFVESNNVMFTLIMWVSSPIAGDITSKLWMSFYNDYVRMVLLSTHLSANGPSKKLTGLVIGLHEEV